MVETCCDQCVSVCKFRLVSVSVVKQLVSAWLSCVCIPLSVNMCHYNLLRLAGVCVCNMYDGDDDIHFSWPQFWKEWRRER